jgi:hypothetical protein
MYHGNAPQELTISVAPATSPSRKLTVSIERATAWAQQAYLLDPGGEEKQNQCPICMGSTVFKARTVESR